MSTIDDLILAEINKYCDIPDEQLLDTDITIERIRRLKGCSQSSARNIFVRMSQSGEYDILDVIVHRPGQKNTRARALRPKSNN